MVRHFLIGCLIGITGGLGNALVTVNLNFAQGTLGLNSDEAAWLTAAYFMTNVTANLLLVKYRQQFGLQPFIRYTLVAYAVTTLMHLFIHDFWTSVAVRAMSGIAASGLSTLTILYFFQALPASKRLAAVMIGICIPQIATPLARVLVAGAAYLGRLAQSLLVRIRACAGDARRGVGAAAAAERAREGVRALDFLTFGLLGAGVVVADRRPLAGADPVVGGAAVDRLVAGGERRADRRRDTG